MKHLRVYIVSLGCPKNLVDTEMMMARLIEAGMELTSDPAEADVILVNTCGFLQDAREESLDAVFEMAAHSPSVLAVTGCMSERYREELLREIPDVDVIFGVSGQERIAEAILEAYRGKRGRRATGRNARPGKVRPRREVFPARVLATPPHTAFLRVADGCDLSCAFCVIPQIRGPQRSRSIDELVEETKALVRAGVVEFSLIAQDTGRYGTDLYGKARLPELLDALSSVSGVKWLRLHYLNPITITAELVDAMVRNQPVCPYLDMPIQHASTRILKAMRRGETRETLAEKVALIRSRMPEAVLRTTVLVGFPGETDEDFSELLEFLEETRFDIVSVFPFSAEEGTPAAVMADQIDPDTIRARHLKAMAESQKASQRRMTAHLDRETEAIIDGPSDIYPDFQRGRIRTQAIDVDGVTYVRGTNLHPGIITRARVIDFDDIDLFAEALP